MTAEEIEQLAADMRQYLKLDAEVVQTQDDRGPASAIWIGDRGTCFFWRDGRYIGARHGYGPTRADLEELKRLPC
jgi:hypothetical protein